MAVQNEQAGTDWFTRHGRVASFWSGLFVALILGAMMIGRAFAGDPVDWVGAVGVVLIVSSAFMVRYESRLDRSRARMVNRVLFILALAFLAVAIGTLGG